MVLLFMVIGVNSNEYVGWKWFLFVFPRKIHSRMYLKNKQQQQQNTSKTSKRKKEKSERC